MRSRDSLIPVTQTPTPCAHCPVRERALYQAVDDDYIHSAQTKRLNQFNLSAKRTLYEEGDHPDMAFTLFSGWIMMYRSDREGDRQGLRIALPGDFVGFLPDTNPSARMNHSAVAVTDALLCGFRQDDLRGMLKQHPQLSWQLNSFQSRDMAACQTTMLNVGRKMADQRIAHLLVELYDRLETLGQVDKRTNTMPFPLTQSMLGDLTGLTQVHTNRVMRRFRDDNLVLCSNQSLQIHNRNALLEIADY